MVININKNNDNYIDISFTPRWEYVSSTKNYIENLMNLETFSKADVYKITMSLAELLENAVKYAKKLGVRLLIKKKYETSEIEVNVFNYIDDEDVKFLYNYVQEMNTKDPLKFYMEKLSTTLNLVEKQSGLGLARINYECGAKISINYSKEMQVVQIKCKIKVG
jgi:hypothetical protein